ncbi:uncharacterized protein DUF563 [Prosthecobacter fusiformis]|uniref:Uncharacterized protein DUF563 n=1 Tax=Prosthecobacter fusiformis TaxID=48464 RepID=A0A4R7S1K7_9BACT|nr:glycosyltransferase family 61 protein [Prosthecobacter fusiformis]TDU71396.1 uncharacterized protein DUF563 [Prosthecobacter fusiformis]
MISAFKAKLLRRPPPAALWEPGDKLDSTLGRIVVKGIRKHHIPMPEPPIIFSADCDTVRFPNPVGVFDGYLVVLDSATVSGQDGFVQLNDGSFLIQPAWHANNLVPNPVYWRRRFTSPVRQRGKWFSCLLFFSYGYYHWICDVLARFHRVLESLPLDTKFLVPWKMETWKWASLEALGIQRERCVQFPPDSHWIFDELYYAPPSAMTGDHDPEAIQWVRDTVVNHYNLTSSYGKNTRLYLTRRHAASRRVQNEDQLWPVLKDAGFKLVEAEYLTFREQVEIFYHASMVLAPHGAGLTNITWCQPGATVLEIFTPSSSDRRCYWTLASALGHSYGAIVGQEDGERMQSMDIVCPRDVLDQALLWRAPHV